MTKGYDILNTFFDYNPTSVGVKYSIDTVMEKYIGRKHELILIEAELEKLIKKIKKGTFSILKGNYKNEVTAKEINESPENKEIERLFKKLFQLKGFDLLWVYTPVPNAMTPCKTLQLLDKNYGVREDGVDYNKKLNISVFVHTGVVTHSEMDAGEVLALILHEVGHNFYQSLFQILERMNPLEIFKEVKNLPEAVGSVVGNIIGFGIVDFLNIGKLHLFIRKAIDTVIDFFRLRPIVMTLQEYMIAVSIFTPRTIQNLISLVSGQLSLKKGVVNPYKILFNYNVEKHADSFAVDYGYGPQLASALNKLDRRENDFAYNIPFVNWVLDFDSLLVDMTFQKLSGYPTVHNRQTSALKRLKEASKDPNLPSHLKKELDDQIEYFEKQYEWYMSIENDENKKRIFTWTYRSFINTVFKGNADIRELIYKMDKSHPKRDKW